jgi:ribonuclease P protein component
MRPEQSLRKSIEFQAVQKTGRRLGNRFVTLRMVRNDHSVTRFGFTVGKYIGNAVTRNHVKRWFREITRRMSVAAGWDIVLVARRDTAKANFHQVQKSVDHILRQAGLI